MILAGFEDFYFSSLVLLDGFSVVSQFGDNLTKNFFLLRSEFMTLTSFPDSMRNPTDVVFPWYMS